MKPRPRPTPAPTRTRLLVTSLALALAATFAALVALAGEPGAASTPVAAAACTLWTAVAAVAAGPLVAWRFRRRRLRLALSGD